MDDTVPSRSRTVKAARVTQFGGLDAIAVESIEIPQSSDREVRVHAAGAKLSKSVEPSGALVRLTAIPRPRCPPAARLVD